MCTLLCMSCVLCTMHCVLVSLLLGTLGTEVACVDGLAVTRVPSLL